MSRFSVWIGRLLLLLSIGLLFADGKEDAREADGGILIGRPVTYKNLTIFPLYLKEEKDVEEYLTLQEAFDLGLVEIREIGASGTVNSVEVENRGKRPIYILAGTVIVGGKQDRVVTKDTIVPPCTTIKVEVCCVERGRWSPQVRRGKKIVFEGVAEANTESNIRRLVQEKRRAEEAQGDVWRRVAQSCRRQQVETETGTYKRLIEVTEWKVQMYLTVFKRVFDYDKDICGFLVSINGVIETCDLFASPRLLSKFKEHLLRSYVIDALNAGVPKEIKPTTIEACREFISDVVMAQRKTETIKEDEHRKVGKLDSDRIIGFSNEDKKSAEVLHLNLFRKK